jgi:branched-subunit amino acid ABC-type transport system permease component
VNGFIAFVLLGLGVGGAYALAAQGMVLIYRGSGVVNLAQGAVAGFGAFSYLALTSSFGLPPLLAVATATLICGAIGLIVHATVMRPLKDSSPLMRLIASTGVMTVLSALLLLRYGSNVQVMKPLFPRTPIHFSSGVALSEDRIWLLGIALVLTVVLAAFYRYTRIGIASSATADSDGRRDGSPRSTGASVALWPDLPEHSSDRSSISRQPRQRCSWCQSSRRHCLAASGPSPGPSSAHSGSGSANHC